MKLRLKYWVQSALVCLVIMVSFVWASPALAQSSANLLQQPASATPTKPMGSAKDLMGVNSEPPVADFTKEQKPTTLNPDRLKQVSESINRSLDPKKATDKSTDRLQVKVEIPPKSVKASKPRQLPGKDR